jgi:hypothetical protein
MLCMLILIAYLESSRRIEFDEYDIIDMQRDSIFRHTIFGIGLLVVPGIFGVFLFFRVIAIFSRAIFSRYGHHAG